MHQLRKTHSLSDIPEGPCLQDNYIGKCLTINNSNLITN